MSAVISIPLIPRGKGFFESERADPVADIGKGGILGSVKDFEPFSIPKAARPRSP
jgi:hypothetical protein